MADIISRLKLESGEFDSKIKRAGQELLAYSEHCRKMGLEMGFANRDAKEFAKQLGSMQTVSQTARGKINELSEAFVNAKVMYKNMTDEEKKGEFGKNLAASLDQLKSRLNSAKQDLADVNKELAGGGKFGEFGNVIDTLGSKMGITGNLTEMLTSKTALLTGAVGAGIAIVTKATEAWAGYNAELAKQDQITNVTTGLKGDDADRMTDKMRALSDTYNVDFREAVNAANTLMTQFGKTGDEATQLIKDGMQGMIQGDGPKLLSMIQQYAPAFRDAGVSASQLVAVIQNSEGGIFTDQNMNAIVMGIKNIRLMTDATSQALAKMGIDGKKMSEQLSNGTLTIFDALKQVSHQLQKVDSNSKTAGEVMQQVFGRQGVTAGTNLAKAIETLNTNLNETKRQTGEVGQSLADLQTANEKLNKAIRDCFEYDGWDQMANGIRSNLITALADVISQLTIIKRLFGSTEDEIKKLIGQGRSSSQGGGAGFNGGGGGGGLRGGNNNQNPNPVPDPNSHRTGGNKNTINKPTYADDSIAAQQAEVQRLTKLWNEASASVKDGYLKQLVEAEKKLKEMQDVAMMEKDLAYGKFSGKGFQNFGEAIGNQGGLRGVETKFKASGSMLLDEKALAAAFKEAGKQSKSKEDKEEKKYLSDGLNQLSGGLGGLQSGFSQLGIDLGDGFGSVVSGLQGISTILMAIQTIVAGIEAISAIDAIIPFANGGIVKAAGGTLVGNSYSGDNLRGIGPGGQLYGLNAGEVVLNRSQVGNIASQLSNSGMQGMKLDAVITGEQIRLVLNNNGRRTGRGEYVQTKSGRV